MRIILFCLLSVMLVLPAFTQVASGKHFEVSINKTGRPEIFHIQGDVKTPIWDKENKSNLVIYVKDTSKRFYLHDMGRFNTYNESNDLFIKWRVEGLEIIEKYTPLDENSLNYSVEIINRGDKSRSVGLYFIYDTYLGESSGKHFIDSEKVVYTREKTFTGYEIPRSIKSLNDQQIGVEYIFALEERKVPERVILGNWEQLSKSRKWPYIPKDGGLFSYGYYSIDDSGIGIQFPQVSLQPMERDTVSFDYRFHSEGETLAPPEFSNTESESKWDEKKYFYEEPVKEEPVKEDTLITVSSSESFTTDNLDGTISSDLPIIEPFNLKLVPETSKKVTKEDLQKMLEYVRLKKAGEDTSGYDFNEQDILEVLKQLNE